jgi:hypothetical protein
MYTNFFDREKEGNRSLGIHGHIWEENIKVDLKQ